MSKFKSERKMHVRTDIQSWNGFEGTWMDYVHHLHTKGALCLELEQKYYGARGTGYEQHSG